ncbi:hypothetical protein QQF64_000939 [Cirrhinus molitorella]|uniref:Uncharacterized protein n=1 Tax=Cirrhinus molitorella TaxID=172907 RepID=A0ABR3NZA7_9TELE
MRRGAGVSEGSEQPTLKKNLERTWRPSNLETIGARQRDPQFRIASQGGLGALLRGQGESAAPLQTPPSRLSRTQGQSEGGRKVSGGQCSVFQQSRQQTNHSKSLSPFPLRAERFSLWLLLQPLNGVFLLYRTFQRAETTLKWAPLNVAL